MFNRDEIAAMLIANDFVAFTYAKANGEVTTRVATVRKRPEDQAPQGKREPSEKDLLNFKYFECGAVNRYDATAPGDWKSFKIANLKKMEPCSQPANWTGE